MKEETITKGHELLKIIETIKSAKTYFEGIEEISLITRQTGTIIEIHLNQSGPARVTMRNLHRDTGELTDKITEEAFKFLQRCKRHCDEAARKHKEELEDL